MGHFARDCHKPPKNANIAQESEQNRKFGELMDFSDISVCKECAITCTDVYSDEEYEDLIVYRDQGISTKTYDEEMYGDLRVMKRRSLSMMWPYALRTVCHWRKSEDD